MLKKFGIFSSRHTLAASVVLTVLMIPLVGHARTPAQEELDSDLVEAELMTTDDEAPPPEYPYPGAKEEGIVAAPRAPAVQRPKKVDEDSGTYFYDTAAESTSRPANAAADIADPKEVKPNGQYLYDVPTEPATFSGRDGVEKPVQTRASGEFNYATEESPRRAAFSFRVGLFSPPDLVNEDTKPNPTAFKNIYTNDQLPVLFLDYEKMLTTSVGRLGLKFGSGIFIAQGTGVFAQFDGNRRPDDQPEEKYSFFMFPNQLTAVYRFQYKDTQPIVPYVEGGAGYFTFMEFRDDSKSPRLGGAATLVGAGGVNFLMDWLDRNAIRKLDTEYGINHVWLTTEFRYIKGLNKAFDFTSSVANVGVLMEF